MIISNATPQLIEQFRRLRCGVLECDGFHDNLALYKCTVSCHAMPSIHAAYGGLNQCVYQLSTMLTGSSYLYKYQLGYTENVHANIASSLGGRS